MKVKSNKNTANSNAKNTGSKFKVLIILFSILLYGQTLSFDFTLDDESFYTQNTLVQDGLKNTLQIFTTPSLGSNNLFTSNQPYRPITILSFAFEHQLWGNNAALSHFINLLLYGILLLVLFNVLSLLFAEYSYVLITLITLLYAAHPIHVEVVSNIKSRDEILAALFGLLSWQFYLSATKEAIANKKLLALSTLMFFFALLSKESAVVFLGILPLSSLLLKKEKLSKTVTSVGFLIIPLIVFLLIRQSILINNSGQVPLLILDNVLNSAQSNSENIATRILILYYNLKMLILPYPLSWDYSYQQVYVTGFSNIYVIAALIIYLTLITSFFYFMKRDSIISFCILFYLGCILPTSNLVFISSANFAERFLFVPSLSIAILICYLIVKYTKSDTRNFNFRWSNMSSKVYLTVLIVFSAITINGAGYWKNNLKLFERGVITSPNSSKTHYNLGQEYWKMAKENNSYSSENIYAIKAIEEFKKSISILPENYMSVTNLACVFELSNQLDSSLHYFDVSKKMYPDQKLIEPNISAVYFKKATQFEVSKMIDSAEANYKIALQYNPSNSLASNNLALISYNKNNIVEAINILKQAIKKDSTDITLVESLSAIFFLTQDYKSAIEYGIIGLNINPQSRKIIGVLADANHALGNNDEVAKYQNMMNAIR